MNAFLKEAYTPLVSVRDVSYEIGGFFQKKKNILKDVSIQFSQNEITTIIGPNGAGKTTLLKIILRLLKPARGSVHSAPKTRISYLPQKMRISSTLPMTVERFLLLDLSPSSKEVDSFLDKVRALKLKKASLLSLSGGELQRVLLARCLIRRPNLLILDEPTQGIDILGQDELYHYLLEEKKRNRTSILIVSHDLHIVMSSSDRIVCLNQHVCCIGHPEHVQRSKAYADLFGEHQSPYRHVHDHKHE